MKAFKVNRIMTSIRRRGDHDSEAAPAENTSDDGPEAVASRSVKQFCESAHNGAQGDEVLLLPPIVEAAESSPAAAAACAKILRHYLSRDYSARPACQYNALMLVRILVDNPGQTFTRNLHRKFADAAKDLFRATKNDSIRSMLMETLDFFEREKNWDEGLQPSVEMWKKEREKSYKILGQKPPPPAPPRPSMPMPSPARSHGPTLHHSSSRQQQQQQLRSSSSSSPRRLPQPAELASRLEEARNSAKLLTQFVANTDAADITSDELVKEFADRCQNAFGNVQAYMKADDPPPDTDTMESLIDTSEQLQSAINQHQRAVLSARKQLGTNARRGSPTTPSAQGALAASLPVAATASVPPPPSPMVSEISVSAPHGNSTRPRWNASGANPAAAAPSLSGYGAGLGSPKGKGIYVSPTIGGSSSTPQEPLERGPSPETPSGSASRWDNGNGYNGYNVGTGSSSSGAALDPRSRRGPLPQHPLLSAPNGSQSLPGVEPPPGPPPGPPRGPPPRRPTYDDSSDDDDLYDSTPKRNRASMHRP